MTPAPENLAPPAFHHRASLERIADLFKVFSDATRLAILQALKAGPMSVGQLVEHLGTTQANVSKHLRVLHDAHILTRHKDGTHAFYAIDDNFVYPLCALVCEKLNRDDQSRQGFDFVI